MSPKLLAKLLEYVHLQNHPTAYGRVGAKYITPCFDNRTGTVFSLTLRGYGTSETVFHQANEYRAHPNSLCQRVLYYLGTGHVIQPNERVALPLPHEIMAVERFTFPPVQV